MKSVSLFSYQGRFKRIFKAYKFEKIYSLAPFFASLLQQRLQRLPLRGPIIPIPSRPWKKYRQGWDQIEMICRFLALPKFHLLKRTSSRAQKALNRKDRIAFIHGQFLLKRNKSIESIKEKPVWLLDDIRTTGATLNEAALVLSNAGFRHIQAITLAVDSD